jgi:hypothetical protein
MSWVQPVASGVGAVVGVFGLFFIWLNWRISELRRSDVLAWSNDVTTALEELLLIAIWDISYGKPTPEERLDDLALRTAVLTERGRFFFRNVQIFKPGADKEPAYRGCRPRILDPIVVAHKIALHWCMADTKTRVRMRLLAEECVKKFVSLAQKEVGRSRSVASELGQTGDDHAWTN